jgi:hypothetical protein
VVQPRRRQFDHLSIDQFALAGLIRQLLEFGERHERRGAHMPGAIHYSVPFAAAMHAANGGVRDIEVTVEGFSRWLQETERM